MTRKTDPPKNAEPIKSVRLSLDEQLRSKGFMIHSRPTTGCPLWVKDNITYSQDDLIRRLPDLIDVDRN